MKKTNIKKILVIMLLVVTLSGCTTTLKDKDNKAVTNKETGQNITENIICRPTDEKVIKIYEDHKKDITKLPECKNLSITGEYEGLWNTFFVRPLAFIIIKVGHLLNSTALGVIAITLILRLILYPLTKKTAIQSEQLKKAQPELNKLEKKYANKTDQESLNKKGQEMLMIYKKYNINPMSGCIFAFIQMPLLLAFWEAINRVPAIFEGKFLGLQMGTTPYVAISHGQWYYLILSVLIILTTYFSFKMTTAKKSKEQNDLAKQQKMMTTFMTVLIGFMSFTLPTALAFYWITSSVFTIIQNFVAIRSLKNE